MEQDVRGMTYLMYSVNPDAMRIRPSLEASSLLAIEKEEDPKKLQCQTCTRSRRSAHTVSPSTTSTALKGERFADAVHSVVQRDLCLETFPASPWVPIVRRVLEYARQRLCLPEVRGT